MRATFFEYVLALGLNQDTVQRLLRQHSILRHGSVLQLLGELGLSVQHVVSEEVTLVQKHFDTQNISTFLVFIQGTVTVVNNFFHWLLKFRFLIG